MRLENYKSLPGTEYQQEKMMMLCRLLVSSIGFLLVFFTAIHAEDWPMYMHDNERTGISSEQVPVPLNLQWVYKSRHAPEPAWPDPYRQDYDWRDVPSLPPLVAYDRAFHVVAAGGRVYFGSSADDQIHCLNASTGEELWSFFAEGPIRFAPTVVGERLLFSSDDGNAYCLSRTTGELQWKLNPMPTAPWIPGNQRLISSFPIRTDVLAANGTGHFGAGLFTRAIGTRRVTVDIATGEEISNGSVSFSPQGYLMVEGNMVRCPTGRTQEPFNPYFEDFGSLAKMAMHLEYDGAVIQVGGVTFRGDDGKVTGGTWSANVEGKAFSLAFSDGRLFASTNRGYIYCFAATQVTPQTIEPATVAFPHVSNAVRQQYQSTAQRIQATAGTAKGYALVLDCEEGGLAHELAAATDLRIICVESDQEKVARARANLNAAGTYGQVSVHHITGSVLPYTDLVFNIVTFDGYAAGGSYSGDRDEALRVLRPYGGKSFFGPGDVMNKGPIQDAVAWTHNICTPANNPNSQSTLVGHDLAMQWFGRPGPKHMIDRHSRGPAPLWNNGMLFISGENYVYGMDGYNGTILWEKEVPKSTRLPGFKDAGQMVAQDDYLYIASDDRCLGLVPETGDEKLSFPIPDIANGEDYAWGYIAVVDDILFGSSEKDSIPRVVTDLTNEFNFMEFGPYAVSDNLFALNRHSGTELWRYIPDPGVLINTAIAVYEGKVIFLESTNAGARNSNSSRFSTDFLLGNGTAYVAALDMTTGDEAWRTPFSFNFQHCAYINCTNNRVILAGSYNDNGQQYDIHSFSITDGSHQWTCKAGTGYDKDDHGNESQHPVVVGNTLYMVPFHSGIAVDITSGQQVNWNFNRDGHACSGTIASKNHLFWRGTNAIAYDITADQRYRLTTATRPGCRIGYVPAGGLLSIPEMSAGCSCGYVIQSSLAFRSTAKLSAPVDIVDVSREKNMLPGAVQKPQLLLSSGRNIVMTVADVAFGERFDLSISDVSGRLMFSRTAISNGLTQSFTWNYHRMGKGVYLVNLKTSRHDISRKILLVK